MINSQYLKQFQYVQINYSYHYQGKWDAQCDGFGSTKNPNITVQVEKHSLTHIELHRTDSGEKMGIILFVCKPGMFSSLLTVARCEKGETHL
jgi:hypothetical protein